MSVLGWFTIALHRIGSRPIAAEPYRAIKLENQTLQLQELLIDEETVVTSVLTRETIISKFDFLIIL